jgi:hypothetical protein
MNWKVDCADCEYSKLITSADEFPSIEKRARNAAEAHGEFRGHDVSVEEVDAVDSVDEDAEPIEEVEDE